jgi:hypothetical protein
MKNGRSIRLKQVASPVYCCRFTALQTWKICMVCGIASNIAPVCSFQNMKWKIQVTQKMTSYEDSCLLGYDAVLVVNCLPVEPKRLEYLSAPAWEPQMSYYRAHVLHHEFLDVGCVLQWNFWRPHAQADESDTSPIKSGRPVTSKLASHRRYAGSSRL